MTKDEKEFDPLLCEKCQVNERAEEHTCPYAVEISDDSESMCTCCSECEHECAMDI